MKQFTFKMDSGDVFLCIAQDFRAACLLFDKNQMGFLPQDILEIVEK
jgi:hypothetical protein